MTTRLSSRQLDAFVKYASIMEKVKKRIRKIERIANCHASTRDEMEDRVEDLATELKRILEDLPYACLGLKIPHLGRRAARYRKDRPPQLIKSDVDGEKLLQTPGRRLRPPFVVLDATVPSNDCMTSAQWESAWAWCNRFAHSRNPVSERPELTWKDVDREWGVGVRSVQRIINLLDTHFVVARGPLDIPRNSKDGGCPAPFRRGRGCRSSDALGGRNQGAGRQCVPPGAEEQPRCLGTSANWGD